VSDLQFFASVAIGWIFHICWVAMRRMVTEIEQKGKLYIDHPYLMNDYCSECNALTDPDIPAGELCRDCGYVPYN
jgi:hypothetical protein